MAKTTTVKPKPPTQEEIDKAKIDEIKKFYESQDNAYKSWIDSQSNAQKSEANASFDKGQQNAYISHMQNVRQTPNDMARLGLSGGASESAMLGQKVGYENNRSNLETGRSSALRDINNRAQEIYSTYKMQSNAQMNADVNAYKNQSAQTAWDKKVFDYQVNQDALDRADTQKQTKISNYIPTLNAIQTTAQADSKVKQIEKWKKTDPKRYKANAWKIAYVKARKGDIIAQKHEEKLRGY